MRWLAVFILLLSVQSLAKEKFACNRSRENHKQEYTHAVNTAMSCSQVCGLAYEAAGAAVCGKLGTDIKINVLDDGLKACGRQNLDAKSCTIKITCDVCPR